MLNNIEMMTKELPMNFGPLKGANANARVTGPCGDTMEFWLSIDNNKILTAAFTTDGCDNSIVCGSTAAYMVQNKTLAETAALTQKDVLLEIGYLPDEFKHCALLAVNTIKKAIEDYQSDLRAVSEVDNQGKSKCDTCTSGSCDTCAEANHRHLNEAELKIKPSQIKHKIAVLSGKGGVGKSTIAVNLALALSFAGYKVGLLDADIHGPSIPTMLNLHGIAMHSDAEGIVPVEIGDLKIISIGFFLENANDALIWRGPMKIGVINQFLNEVKWGDLDFLIVDLPPGTGDEPLSICQTFSDQDSAIIVTTPQKVATADVSKSINFCRELKLSVLGIIENMSGFICPKCNEIVDIFGAGGGKQLANDFNIPLLGKIPIDSEIASACDQGVFYLNAYSGSKTAKVFKQIIDFILQYTNINLSSN